MIMTLKLKVRRWLLLAAFLFLAVLNLQAEKPNIIFVLTDDLGYGDLGSYGQKMVKTPHLDRFASEGIRFTDAYSGHTVCGPSRCTFLTGKHTGHATVRGNKGAPRQLNPDETTVAKLLRSAGYHTAIFGKWGFLEQGETGQPAMHGFDESYYYGTHKDAHTYLPEKLWRNGKQEDVPKGSFSHDLFTNESLKFLERKHEKPFFLFLAFCIPHAKVEHVPDTAPYSDKDWPLAEKQFAAMIHRLDESMGKLLEKLKETGLESNTLVVFTSDNGAHREGRKPDFTNSTGGLRGIKRDLYEGGIRVPFLVRWPGQVPAGVVSNEILANWDMLPTFAEFAGVEAPRGIDGISLKKLFLGESGQEQHAYLYWESYERDGFEQAARKGKWKAVTSGKNTPIELFDLSNDLAEKNDVAAENPEVVAEIKKIMVEGRTDDPRYPIPEGPRKRPQPKM
jgi:arylsulfatase A-like enzyme